MAPCRFGECYLVHGGVYDGLEGELRKQTAKFSVRSAPVSQLASSLLACLWLSYLRIIGPKDQRVGFVRTLEVGLGLTHSAAFYSSSNCGASVIS